MISSALGAIGGIGVVLYTKCRMNRNEQEQNPDNEQVRAIQRVRQEHAIRMEQLDLKHQHDIVDIEVRRQSLLLDIEQLREEKYKLETVEHKKAVN